ncbi:FecR protein [Neisseria bacilliformis ATCC BAA-1200]|uniref:FecR protein n=1 Tax=Neisseria bacilliformis ATCC BAA-1200 TaxID=888742 RepID=F2BFE1_9NEIS|nr:FecR protein [Neisseria bacilliformis ATCC BAA-1200]
MTHRNHRNRAASCEWRVETHPAESRKTQRPSEKTLFRRPDAKAA